MMNVAAPRRSASIRNATNKFARRQAEILDMASAHINTFGVRGMTLTAVARALGIDTSSITYYFRKKEDLAAACLDRTLNWQRQQAEIAASEPDSRSAVRSYLRSYLDVHREERPSGEPRLAVLSDMRSMSGDRRKALFDKYAANVRLLRHRMEADLNDRSRSLIAISVVSATMNWMTAWIGEYHDDDFPRIESRLFDLLEHGIGNGNAWEFKGALPLEEDPGDAQARFIDAATNLINREGYHGASVEKIAAELGVSTGSFYHHLENKDELVVACFQRSYSLLDRAREVGEASGDGQVDRLARTVSSLVRLQLAGPSPLLRASAYQALPPELRERMLQRNAQLERHIAGVVADGIAEGGIRAVDPTLASHFIVSVVNAAAGLRRWASERRLDDAVTTYCDILRRGIF